MNVYIHICIIHVKVYIRFSLHRAGIENDHEVFDIESLPCSQLLGLGTFTLNHTLSALIDSGSIIRNGWFEAARGSRAPHRRTSDVALAECAVVIVRVGMLCLCVKPSTQAQDAAIARRLLTITSMLYTNTAMLLPTPHTEVCLRVHENIGGDRESCSILHKYFQPWMNWYTIDLAQTLRKFIGSSICVPTAPYNK